MNDNERHVRIDLTAPDVEDQLDEWTRSLDVNGEHPWRGPNRPADIEPNTCPHGLVFVVVDGEDREQDRLAIGAFETRTAEAAQQVELIAAHPGWSLVVYDGDSGRPVTRLTPGSE